MGSLQYPYLGVIHVRGIFLSPYGPISNMVAPISSIDPGKVAAQQRIEALAKSIAPYNPRTADYNCYMTFLRQVGAACEDLNVDRALAATSAPTVSHGGSSVAAAGERAAVDYELEEGQTGHGGSEPEEMGGAKLKDEI